jgi:hypothetical protein
LEPNTLYQLDYKIKTINNLEASTEKYDIMLQEGIWPETDFSITGKLNFDNAYVDLFLNTKNNSASGAFIISRTDSKSNYSDWITLTNLSVRHHVFNNEFIYRDYSIEHGVKYIYSI